MHQRFIDRFMQTLDGRYKNSIWIRDSLEKQMLQHPRHEDYMYTCPRCGKEFGLLKCNVPKYCWNCGQKVGDKK